MISGGQNVNDVAEPLVPTADFDSGQGYSYVINIFNSGPNTVYVGDVDHAGSAEGYPIASGKEHSFHVTHEVLYIACASTQTAFIRKLIFKD